ncbi:MAG: SnoaL-like domain-containing protein [Pricia sp.]|nr:SnoaL-like domain-containing protein [Pricia sp.]
MEKKATQAFKKPDELVLEFFERVWHPPHELDAIDELMTSDYQITTAGTVISGREEFKNWVKRFQELLLDAKTINSDLFFNKDQTKVVSRWVCTGKNNGLFGLDPDQRPISFTGIAIWKVSNGRLSKCWVERSAHELYQKLSSEQQKAN